MSKLIDQDKSLEELARENIARLRKERGWSQAEVAQRMSALGFDGFGQMTVSRTEKGERPLRVSELEGYAGLFEVHVHELWQTSQTRALMEATRELRDATSDLQSATARYVEAQKSMAAVVEPLVHELDDSEAAITLFDIATLPQHIVQQSVEDYQERQSGQRREFLERASNEAQAQLEAHLHREFWAKPDDERSMWNIWKGLYGERQEAP